MQASHMKKKIRIVLVDDHETVRESWKFFLEKDERFVVIAQCKNGREAVEQAQSLMPDIMLMDINMSVMNGFEATQKIIEQTPSVKIIGLSVNNHAGYAAKLLELGARGFVTKGSPISELTKAILKVHAGEEYVCDEINNNASHSQNT